MLEEYERICELLREKEKDGIWRNISKIIRVK